MKKKGLTPYNCKTIQTTSLSTKQIFFMFPAILSFFNVTYNKLENIANNFHSLTFSGNFEQISRMSCTQPGTLTQ